MKLHDLAARNLCAFTDIDITGRTKLATDEICDKDLTLIDFGYGTDRKTGHPYAVCLFDEFENGFYMAGLVLSELCIDIAADEEAFAEFKKTGLMISLHKRISKKEGNEYISVELL